VNNDQKKIWKEDNILTLDWRGLVHQEKKKLIHNSLPRREVNPGILNIRGYHSTTMLGDFDPDSIDTSCMRTFLLQYCFPMLVTCLLSLSNHKKKKNYTSSYYISLQGICHFSLNICVSCSYVQEISLATATNYRHGRLHLRGLYNSLVKYKTVYTHASSVHCAVL
jgi:hypothetical protein